jgi:23S rRNA (guanosine2251-2'-O)-methyltransferase
MDERIIYGINTVRKALDKRPEQVLRIYLQRELGAKRLARLADDLRRHRVAVERLTAEELATLTGSAAHQGVAAALTGAAALDDRGALDYLAGIEKPLILLLDGVEDPRNFGACLRTADGAGVDLVATGRSRGVDITPVVSKVASGAAESQPIARVANLARFMSALSDLGIRIVGTVDDAPEELYACDLTGPLAIALGSEGKGLRRLSREHCDSLVRIPMHGAVESLNVSVAAGVCLYEALRQRS